MGDYCEVTIRKEYILGRVNSIKSSQLARTLRTIHFVEESAAPILLSDSIKETFTLQLVEQTHIDEARHLRFVFAECRD